MVLTAFSGFFYIEFDPVLDILHSKKLLLLFKLSATASVDTSSSCFERNIEVSVAEKLFKNMIYNAIYIVNKVVHFFLTLREG